MVGQKTSLLLAGTLLALLGMDAQVSEFIHIDQFGYQPEMTKVAVISDPQTGFNAGDSYTPGMELVVKRVNDDQIVYSAPPQIWNSGQTHAQSGDRGWWVDFSALTTTGEYYIEDPTTGHVTESFLISESVYEGVLRAAMRTFYYNRSNEEKSTPYADSAWEDGVSFLNPGQDSQCRYIYDQGNASLAKELSGGWFDAGDYNKYVSFAADPIHDLLWSYQRYPAVFGDDTDIPESGNGRADIIDEVLIELDWVMKMNNPDGSTHNKMGSTAFGINEDSPPSNNFAPRYYGPTCTSSSITAATMFAHAAVVLADFPELASYVDDLEQRAVTSWAYVLPYINSGTLETDCDDGSITAGDCDMTAEDQVGSSITAAIYLLALTGEQQYTDYLESNIPLSNPLTNGVWSIYDRPLQDALVFYSSLPQASTSVSQLIVDSFDADVSWNGELLYGDTEADLYRSQMPSWSYHWGSNMLKAGYGLLNRLAGELGVGSDPPSSYLNKSAEYIHYFHGVNPMGYTYLSNMGGLGAEGSLDEIFHLWFYEETVWDNVTTSLYGPPPGYLSGGPNQYFSLETLSPPAGQPPMKAFLEFNSHEDRSYEVQEPAIYYQATYIRLLAAHVALSENCAADIDQNGTVDVSDFIQFNSGFGDPCADCPEDLNGDGEVNVIDFLQYNSAFGNACD